MNWPLLFREALRYIIDAAAVDLCVVVIALAYLAFRDWLDDRATLRWLEDAGRSESRRLGDHDAGDDYD
jgi:hypothetical protein